MANKRFSILKIARTVCVIFLVCCLLSVSVFAAGDLSYDGYNYDAYGVSTPVPEGYERLQKSGEKIYPAVHLVRPKIFFMPKTPIFTFLIRAITE